MAELTAGGGRLILDAGGVSALARGDGIARATIERARRVGWPVIIPTPVLVEVHSGRREHAHIDRVVKAVDLLIPTSALRAREAGALRFGSGVLDVVDAIVAAEAIAAAPAVIVTSDPDDLGRLVDAAGRSAGVLVIAV